VEQSEGQDVPTSWMLDLLNQSRLLPQTARQIQTALACLRRHPAHAPAALAPANRDVSGVETGLLRLLGLAALAVAGWGFISLVQLVWALPLEKWLEISEGTGASVLRIAVALAISFAWTVPVGVAIGLHPRLARAAQPLAQIAASVPATAVFPILLLLLVRLGGGLSIASVLLMLLGTQWYILFNTIAGAIALPRDLQEAASLMKMRGWMRWRTLILPGIFPHLVTGGLTAQGGAFNATIVSEYVTFDNKVLQTIGLGALISAAAAGGDYPLLAAATVTMAVVVVIINRLFWKRAAHLAEDRYHL